MLFPETSKRNKTQFYSYVTVFFFLFCPTPVCLKAALPFAYTHAGRSRIVLAWVFPQSRAWGGSLLVPLSIKDAIPASLFKEKGCEAGKEREPVSPYKPCYQLATAWYLVGVVLHLGGLSSQKFIDCFSRWFMQGKKKDIYLTLSGFHWSEFSLLPWIPS